MMRIDVYVKNWKCVIKMECFEEKNVYVDLYVVGGLERWKIDEFVCEKHWIIWGKMPKCKVCKFVD